VTKHKVPHPCSRAEDCARSLTGIRDDAYLKVVGDVNGHDKQKKIKRWRRAKKDKLVESINPDWKHLAADWYTDELLLDGKPTK
jgi:hypothetical protein